MNPSIFTRGAVDLSALRRPAPTTAAPAGPAATSAVGGAEATGGAIIDVTEAMFQSEIAERSMTTPVVACFWAAGHEESSRLLQSLGSLAAEGAGAWVLARLDLEVNQRLAQAFAGQMFRGQDLPWVMAFVGGQPVDAFAGAVPEPQLRQWLAAILKAGGIEVALPEDPRLDAADEALMVGDLDAAETAFRKILADTPGDAAAEAGLAQVALTRRAAGTDPAAALSAAQTAPDDVAAQLLAADVETLGGFADRAYLRLVDLVRRTSGDEREQVRQHLVSLFAVAAPDDPAVGQARRALASALF